MLSNKALIHSPPRWIEEPEPYTLPLMKAMAAANLRYLDHDDEGSEHLSFLDPSPPAETTSSFPRGRFQLHTLGIIMVLVFLFDFSGSLTGASTLRIYESIICHSYYKANDPSRIGDGEVVDERYCKVDAVQEELAVLTGGESFFNTLPGKSSWYLLRGW